MSKLTSKQRNPKRTKRRITSTDMAKIIRENIFNKVWGTDSRPQLVRVKPCGCSGERFGIAC